MPCSTFCTNIASVILDCVDKCTFKEGNLDCLLLSLRFLAGAADSGLGSAYRQLHLEEKLTVDSRSGISGSKGLYFQLLFLALISRIVMADSVPVPWPYRGWWKRSLGSSEDRHRIPALPLAATGRLQINCLASLSPSLGHL